MKNKLTVFFVLSLVIFVAIGCSFGGLTGSDEMGSGDSTTSDKTKEAAPSGEVIKVGIPECDEMATYINDNSEAIEGSYIAKGIVYLYKNYILEEIKKGIENMTEEDKAKLGKACKKSLEDLKKSVK